MEGKINSITRVEIKSLWNRFDLEWDLNPDVNVLSGINGSGKSTILNCIAGLMTIGSPFGDMAEIIQSSKIFFGNGRYLLFNRIRESKSFDFKVRGFGNYKRLKDDTIGLTAFENQELTIDELYEYIGVDVDIISTFDNTITEIGNRPDESVKTELDRDIFRLQKEYLDYQLNISKKVFDSFKRKNEQSQDEILNIRKQQDRFLEIIDNLFAETGKKIDREKNEIVFLNGKEELSAYQLSSGEKQMLVILLTVLVQDQKPYIVFMDEPEISLHFDWQKKLIGYVRELNPNAQIILATHSPAVIMEGWLDKVKDVRDLIVLDRQKNNEKG